MFMHAQGKRKILVIDDDWNVLLTLGSSYFAILGVDPSVPLTCLKTMP